MSDMYGEKHKYPELPLLPALLYSPPGYSLHYPHTPLYIFLSLSKKVVEVVENMAGHVVTIGVRPSRTHLKSRG